MFYNKEGLLALVSVLAVTLLTERIDDGGNPCFL